MVDVVEADLSRPDDAQAVIDLLNRYAQEPAGGGAELEEEVRRDLIPALQRRRDALILLAMQDLSLIHI